MEKITEEMEVIGEMSTKEVLNMIEIFRKRLVSLAQHKDLIDPEVIHLSQILDSWLNLYERIQAKSAKL